MPRRLARSAERSRRRRRSRRLAIPDDDADCELVVTPPLEIAAAAGVVEAPARSCCDRHTAVPCCLACRQVRDLVRALVKGVKGMVIGVNVSPMATDVVDRFTFIERFAHGFLNDAECVLRHRRALFGCVARRSFPACLAPPRTRWVPRPLRASVALPLRQPSTTTPSSTTTRACRARMRKQSFEIQFLASR